MKELDVLLERWLGRHAGTAERGEIQCFEALLDLQDPQLARYLLAGDPHPDHAIAALIERIRRA
jgi:succinate dehydrogenase flavin-adding protein (antitoxin of CptAB toxin-antitoxin module)